MIRNPHPTLAHMVRDAQCAGKCRQGRPSATACLHKTTCGSYLTTLHRVTPAAAPVDEGPGVLHFLEAILMRVDVLAMGGIAACLVAMAILAAHVIVWLIELAEVAAKAGAL